MKCGKTFITAVGIFGVILLFSGKATAGEFDYSDKPTSTGVGGVVSGSVLLGLGGINLVFTPLCVVEDFGLGTSGCVATQLIGGGLLVAIGIPVLIAGKIRRDRYKEWLRNRRFALAPSVSPDFSGLSMSLAF